MIQILNRGTGEWTQFYPFLDITESIDTRPLEELPNDVMGKYIIGVAGYNPIWAIVTIDKSKLREIDEKKNRKI